MLSGYDEGTAVEVGETRGAGAAAGAGVMAGTLDELYSGRLENHMYPS